MTVRPANWPAGLRDPEPRDWVEDDTHENGHYHCTCLSCGSSFIGHKRRMCCHVCFDAMQKVEDDRAAIIASAGLVPADWRLLTRAEVDNMHGLYAGQAFRMAELEKALSDIATTAHCLAKAGPLHTPDLKTAWTHFLHLSTKATAALSKARTNPPSL